ncbi:MAG: hypothetical protein ACNA71_02545, partial [Kiritimatiellia bacterium]
MQHPVGPQGKPFDLPERNKTMLENKTSTDQSDVKPAMPSTDSMHTARWIYQARLFMLVLANIWLFGMQVYADSNSTRDSYTMHVTLDVAAGKLYGTNTFTINPAHVDRTQVLPIFAYPNHYATVSPAISHKLYDRVFPESLSLGDMRLERVLINGQDTAFSTTRKPRLTDGVLLTAAIPDPHLTSQSHATVSISFVVNIPERFGTFGRYQSAICLNGGWYPYLPAKYNSEWLWHAPPPESSFRLQLSVNQEGHIFINGQHHEARPGNIIQAEFEARYLSFVFVPQIHEYQKKRPGMDLRYVTSRPREKDALVLLQAASMAMDFLHAKTDLKLPEEILFIEAPLRRDLAIPAAGMVLVSDRFKQVLNSLR